MPNTERMTTEHPTKTVTEGRAKSRVVGCANPVPVGVNAALIGSASIKYISVSKGKGVVSKPESNERKEFCGGGAPDHKKSEGTASVD